jgi:hypothetical protein
LDRRIKDNLHIPLWFSIFSICCTMNCYIIQKEKVKIYFINNLLFKKQSRVGTDNGHSSWGFFCGGVVLFLLEGNEDRLLRVLLYNLEWPGTHNSPSSAS